MVIIEAGWALAVLAAWSVLTWLSIPIVSGMALWARRKARTWRDRRQLRKHARDLWPNREYERIGGGDE